MKRDGRARSSAESHPAGSAGASPSKARKPLDPKAREHQARAARVRRRFKKLKDESTLEQMEAAIDEMERAKLDEVVVVEPEPIPASEGQQAAPKGEPAPAVPVVSDAAAAPVIAPEPTPAAPSSPRRGPSWPTDAEIEAAKGEVAPLIQALSTICNGTRFERCFSGQHPKLDIAAGCIVHVPKEQALTDAFAPLWAKHVGELVPMEIACAVEVLAILAAPFIQDRLEAAARRAAEQQKAAAQGQRVVEGVRTS